MTIFCGLAAMLAVASFFTHQKLRRDAFDENHDLIVAVTVAACGRGIVVRCEAKGMKRV